jgi:ubiquinone/menaquinone biosynthesis C-methylase UbiE
MPLTPAGSQAIDPTFRREEERIRSAYAAREGEACYAESLAGRFQIQERERHVLQLLDRHDLMPLSGRRILEVGCGTGKWLRDLIAWGADPENIFGMELLQASAARARRLCPQSVTIECGNAAELRFESESFDIVLQATVFTSVLDLEMKRAMAAEMLRVLRPRGVILWYDFFFKNPRNPYVLPVTKTEIRQLFPGCSLELRRVTLAPPLARLVAPRSWVACSVLSRIPPLCTHYLGAIRRPDVPR